MKRRDELTITRERKKSSLKRNLKDFCFDSVKNILPASLYGPAQQPDERDLARGHHQNDF